MYGARIRYIKAADGGLKSLRSYNGITVYLYPEAKSFTLLTESGIVHEGEVGGGLHKLKIAAKKAREFQGIEFSKEQRNVKDEQNG